MDQTTEQLREAAQAAQQRLEAALVDVAVTRRERSKAAAALGVAREAWNASVAVECSADEELAQARVDAHGAWSEWAKSYAAGL